MAISNNFFSQVNGKVISRELVKYPVYDSIRGMEMYYSKEIYNKSISDHSSKTEKIFYWSDGLKVVTYLSVPAITPKSKLPVIIFNRGSYIRNDIAFVHAPLFQKLVKGGFIVIAPALRESEGGDGKDEIGGKELDDILNIVPLLSALPFADTSNIFMLGESRGGIMTYIALHKKISVKAVATIGAITDMEMFLRDNPAAGQLLKQVCPGYEDNKQQALDDRSAIKWAEDINVPVLIMQGQADPQVKPLHSLLLAGKLQELGKVYQLLILEGGNHILSDRWVEERDRQVIDWFKKYLSN